MSAQLKSPARGPATQLLVCTSTPSSLAGGAGAAAAWPLEEGPAEGGGAACAGAGAMGGGAYVAWGAYCWGPACWGALCRSAEVSHVSSMQTPKRRRTLTSFLHTIVSRQCICQ